jgi:ubiquinone/menaquinone biosynthesis C-methylase UbiE
MGLQKGGNVNTTSNTDTAGLFDAIASAYETWAEPVSVRLAQVALGKTSVRAGDRVLDIGAGTGALGHQAAVLGASVTAIDLSSAMVARSTQRPARYPECKALMMDGQALTFEDSTFDAAFCILSTTLFPAWDAGPGEAVRVVRPGGRIAIVHWANPEGADIFSILSRALKKLPLPTGSPDAPRLTVLMSVHELRAALEAREREVIDVERVDAPSPLPTPESFMDMLDAIYRAFRPTVRSMNICVANCVSCLRRKLVDGSTRTCRLVAQVRPTWRSPAASQSTQEPVSRGLVLGVNTAARGHRASNLAA